MSRYRLLQFLLLILALSAAGCNVRVIRGSGDVVTEDRAVSDFNHIVLSGSGRVVITQTGSESLSVETDDNIMEYIKTEVNGRTLELGFENMVAAVSTTRLVYYVQVDDLDELTISGSGSIEMDLLETDRLDITISGSGNVQVVELAADEVDALISGSGEIMLAGEASSQDVRISGSGEYLAGDLCSADIEVSISGSGDATLCASESLDASINGSGSVNYYGRPSIKLTGNGSGDLNNLGEK